MADYPGFVGSSYTSQAPPAACERTVNWYVERLRAEHGSAKVPAALYPTPGFIAFAAAPAGYSPGRGLFKVEDRVFAAIGSRLYEVGADGTLTVLGEILQDAEPVTAQTNGDLNNQLMIASNGALFCFDLSTNTLTAIATMTSGVRMVDYLDGYFFALKPATSTIFLSNLGQGLTWNALRIRERSLAPDRWQAMIVPPGSADVWAFGSLTTDILYNTGVAPVPIAPRPGVKIGWGIQAPRSLAALGGSPIWLAQDRNGGGMVMHAEGYLPRRISHHAMETALSRYSTLADAVGWTYQQDGHTFYVLSFGAAGATWVYDAAVPGQWHERDYLDPVTAQPRAWRAQHHVFAFGKHLVQDRESGAIYELSLTTGTDIGGSAIRRLRQAPVLQLPGRATMFLHALQIDIQAGLGLTTGQGADPLGMLEVSHDGGMTWGPIRTRKLGALGAYALSVVFRDLGSGEQNAVRFTISDPIPARVLGASLSYTAGTDGV